MMLFATFVLGSCTFDKLPLGDAWRCVEGGSHPEWQKPRVCDTQNAMRPKTFDVLNITHNNGTWSLKLDPYYNKPPAHDALYTFELRHFECTTLEDAEATILVTPVNEVTPTQVRLRTCIWIALLACFAGGGVYVQERFRARPHSD